MVKHTKGTARNVPTQVSNERRLLVNQTMKAMKIYLSSEKYDAFELFVKDQVTRSQTLQDIIIGKPADVLSSILAYAQAHIPPDALAMMNAFIGLKPSTAGSTKEFTRGTEDVDNVDFAVQPRPCKTHVSRVKFTLGRKMSKLIDQLEKTPVKANPKQVVKQVSLPRPVAKALKLWMESESTPLKEVDLPEEVKLNVFKTYPVTMCSKKHKGKCNELGINVHVSKTLASSIKQGNYVYSTTGSWLNPCLQPTKMKESPSPDNQPLHNEAGGPSYKAVGPPPTYESPDSKIAKFHLLAKSVVLGTQECETFRHMVSHWKGPLPQTELSHDAKFVVNQVKSLSALAFSEKLKRAILSRKRPSTSRSGYTPQGKHAKR